MDLLQSLQRLSIRAAETANLAIEDPILPLQCLTL